MIILRKNKFTNLAWKQKLNSNWLVFFEEIKNPIDVEEIEFKTFCGSERRKNDE